MVLGLAAASCAAPALTLYTLTPGAGAVMAPLGHAPVVIALARVTIPDELDNDDILVRAGSRLVRSATGRYGSRLSIEITDRITAQLAARYPNALVTSRPGSQAVAYRVLIDVSRLDVSADGRAELAADWQVIPPDPASPIRRDRAVVRADRALAADADVIAVEQTVIDGLGRAIRIDGAE